MTDHINDAARPVNAETDSSTDKTTLGRKNAGEPQQRAKDAESDGFKPGDVVDGWIPGSEGQMLQQMVKENDLRDLPTGYAGTSGISTNRGAASQQHDETPADRKHGKHT